MLPSLVSLLSYAKAGDGWTMMYSLVPFTLELCFNILCTETSTYDLQNIYKVDSNIREILALCGILEYEYYLVYLSNR